MALNPEQLAKWNSGAAAAKQAMDNSDRPIMLMDELLGLGTEPDIEAMGWNSVCVSEENRARWKIEGRLSE